jgi:catechol-2,3-dioxygenase
MPVAPKFVHVALQTNQLAAMRDFYCTMLGAHVVYENGVTCFITFDEEHHRMAFFQPPQGQLPERTPATVGLGHSSFTFPTLGELVEKYLELREAGIKPRVPVQHGVTTSLYYRDPDGNGVELQIDNFADADEATAYMMGPEYAADPIGPSFDADALAKDYQAGVPEAELRSRAWAAATPQLNVIELLTS